METKIRVHATAQNRTALGIINAYLVLFPKSTLDDLNKAFPSDLNKSNRSDTLLIDVRDAGKFISEDGVSNFEKYFLEREDEVLHLKDGITATLIELWTKDDFEKIVEHARQYGIEVASFENAIPFERGSFELEYVNDYGLVGGVVQKIEKQKEEPPVKKKKCRWWWWLLAAILLIVLILFLCCFLKCCDCRKPTCATQQGGLKGDTVAAQVDTTNNSQDNNPINEAEEAVKKMDLGEAVLSFPVTFEKGSSALDPASHPALEPIANYLSENPDAKLNIIGHSSTEGSEALNLRLSKARAQSVANYLLSEKGIDASRLIVEGKGKSEAIYDDQEKNRRIEIKIIK